MPALMVPDSLAPDMVAAIDETLDRIVHEQSVRLPIAVESGSRAWGFPSPDSDYDCRFLFVRSEADYLGLFPRRDVIEVPPDGLLDINGWDLAKALRLMLKGNAVVLEWLRSPIVYRCHSGFSDALLALAEKCSDRRLIGRHYLHVGERQLRTQLAAGEAVPLKKLLYVLRPAAVLRWMRFHSELTVPPMHLPTLLAECEPSADIAGEIADLVARKAETRELGSGPLSATIVRFIADEFAAARPLFEPPPSAPHPDAVRQAEAFFREAARAEW